MRRGLSIDDTLRPLSDGLQAYLTNVIQVSDLLEWVLKQVGRSEVWQSTSSVSEEFLRRLYHLRKSGLIERLNLLLDLKATNKTLTLWPFILKTIDSVNLADNHSKLILVRSLSGDCVTVITSQNLTRGNRYESAIITTEKNIFDSLKTQFDYIVTNKSVPLNDLYRQRTGED